MFREIPTLRRAARHDAAALPSLLTSLYINLSNRRNHTLQPSQPLHYPPFWCVLIYICNWDPPCLTPQNLNQPTNQPTNRPTAPQIPLFPPVFSDRPPLFLPLDDVSITCAHLTIFVFPSSPHYTLANPTVRGIQQLRKNSIQTIRDISDVLRHIIKNVSERLVRNIANLGQVYSLL
jgi:hypothetical protein